MELLYYLFSNKVKYEDRLDVQGNYIEFPCFKDHIYPIFINNNSKIESIYLISNRYNKIDKNKLNKLKVPYEHVIDSNTYKLSDFDLHDKEIRNLLLLYSSCDSELNALYQFSDEKLLSEVINIFQKPFRKSHLIQNDLKLPENDLIILSKIITKFSSNSYFLSIGDDENELFLFSNESNLNKICELMKI